MFQIKRIYLPAQASDGYRVLVDRLWPRGVSRQKARLDLLKEIGPSDALRKRLGHEPERWPEFERRYRKELRAKPELVRQIRQLQKEHGKVTLLFSARDEERNQALALRDFLQGRR